MRVFTALATAVLFLTAPVFTAGSDAPPPKYRFELTGAPRATVAGAHVVSVRLIAADGKLVSGAAFTQIRLDMSPDHMAGMTAPVREIPDGAAGIYSFSFDDNAVWKWKGNWALSLSAKVPGASQAVTGRVVFHSGT